MKLMLARILSATLGLALVNVVPAQSFKDIVPPLPDTLASIRVKTGTRTLSEAVHSFAEWMTYSDEDAWSRYQQEGASGGLSYMGFGANLSQDKFLSEFRSRRTASARSASSEDALRVCLEYTRDGVEDTTARELINNHYALLNKIVEAQYLLASKEFFSLTISPGTNTAKDAVVSLNWVRSPDTDHSIEHVVIRSVTVSGDTYRPMDFPKLVTAGYKIGIKKPSNETCNVVVHLSLSSTKPEISVFVTLSKAEESAPSGPSTPKVPPPQTTIDLKLTISVTPIAGKSSGGCGTIAVLEASKVTASDGGDWSTVLFEDPASVSFVTPGQAVEYNLKKIPTTSKVIEVTLKGLQGPCMTHKGSAHGDGKNVTLKISVDGPRTDKKSIRFNLDGGSWHEAELKGEIK